MRVFLTFENLKSIRKAIIIYIYIIVALHYNFT